jgi:hypothetical protein
VNLAKNGAHSDCHADAKEASDLPHEVDERKRESHFPMHRGNKKGKTQIISFPSCINTLEVVTQPPTTQRFGLLRP